MYLCNYLRPKAEAEAKVGDYEFPMRSLFLGGAHRTKKLSNEQITFEVAIHEGEKNWVHDKTLTRSTPTTTTTTATKTATATTSTTTTLTPTTTTTMFAVGIIVEIGE